MSPWLFLKASRHQHLSLLSIWSPRLPEHPLSKSPPVPGSPPTLSPLPRICHWNQKTLIASRFQVSPHPPILIFCTVIHFVWYIHLSKIFQDFSVFVMLPILKCWEQTACVTVASGRDARKILRRESISSENWNIRKDLATSDNKDIDRIGWGGWWVACRILVYTLPSLNFSSPKKYKLDQISVRVRKCRVWVWTNEIF